MKGESIAIIIVGIVIAAALIFLGSSKDMHSSGEPISQSVIEMEDPSSDNMSAGENIHISIPNDSYSDEYWEVEYCNGDYYKVRREDFDEELDGYLDNEEEMLINIPH